MTLNTSTKPGDELALPVGKWTTVAVSTMPAGAEGHAMLYANLRGTLANGAACGLVEVRALRNGAPQGSLDFDETALQGFAAPASDGSDSFRLWITHTWFGSTRTVRTMHWQIRPGHNIATAAVKGSRYAKGMSN